MPNEHKAYQKIFASQTFAAIKRGKISGENITKYIIDTIKIYYDSFPYSIRFFVALFFPRIIFKRFFKV
jgi:hypothetical protein